MSGTAGKTLDQRRAHHAWAAVSTARESLQGNLQQSYAREAKRLTVRIRTSGLGQTLAFTKAKASNSNANLRLAADLDDWLLKHRVPPGRPPASKSLTEAICDGDSTFLRLATDEALAWLQWLTRFAEAEFGTGDE